jgi:hypothetical protein
VSTIPLELPLKANEAAALADLIFQQLEGRAPSDDQRKRLTARAAVLELSSIRPYWGSLEADPVHTHTYFLAVDAIQGGRTSELLLRMAPSSSPSSGLFPKAILIGRMRPGAGREVVVNAIPFAITDAEAIHTFAAKVNRAFQPRPQGVQPSVTLEVAADAQEIVAAYPAFQRLLLTTGINYAAFTGPLSACAWGAIRAGWRHGYTAETPVAEPEQVLGLIHYTRFSARQLPRERHEQLIDLIRAEKLRAGLGRAFDYEIAGTADAAGLLADLRADGRTVQLLAPGPGADLDAAAALARRYQLTLSFHSRDGYSAEDLRRIGEATAGRWNYTVDAARTISEAVVQLRA